MPRKFEFMEAVSTRDTLIALEKHTFGSDSHHNLTDLDMVVRILVQLNNDLAEQENHTHSIR